MSHAVVADLVRTGHRWYLVAPDVARGEWRTFRADRVAEAHPTGHLVRLVDPPDAALLVSRMLTSDYPLYTTIRLPLPLDQAMRLVPPNLGTHRPDGPDATIVTIGGSDADGLATYLLRLGTPLRVLSRDDVREGLRRRVRDLLDDEEGGPR